jgi:hypothetical protein
VLVQEVTNLEHILLGGPHRLAVDQCVPNLICVAQPPLGVCLLVVTSLGPSEGGLSTKLFSLVCAQASILNALRVRTHRSYNVHEVLTGRLRLWPLYLLGVLLSEGTRFNLPEPLACDSASLRQVQNGLMHHLLDSLLVERMLPRVNTVLLQDRFLDRDTQRVLVEWVLQWLLPYTLVPLGLDRLLYTLQGIGVREYGEILIPIDEVGDELTRQHGLKTLVHLLRVLM